ncbi:class I adenylate-forming enzyme family protein [Antrihabitans stalactiti]|uniref:Long-chain fatty acid--CoA ligase n=1 Tax=Antrihabitans stalactiti TaxID=2584121 RepID=A0A848KJG1_9NOCA|nr:AMP-binding protein [Antrihabitans stalactiti]NMN98409.1 long-chain fatty acid--CoA ligase [Antrihabitans stalactiti]
MTPLEPRITDHFAALCDARAAAEPDGPAIGDGNKELTNRELLNRVVVADAQLREHGATAGDVVAIRLPSGLEFVIFLFAAWRSGCTVTPINPGLLEDELLYQLSDSGAALVVDLDGSTPTPGLPVIAVRNSPVAGVDTTSDPVVDGDSLALLIYTSGTTGRPKGVMLTHANIVAMATMGARSLGITRADSSLLILPLFHVNGIVVSVLIPMLYGGSTIIAGRFDPATFFDLVAKVRPSYFSGVPTIYSMLAAVPDRGAVDTSSLRFGLCGAAPAPNGLLEEFESRFGFPIVEGYGLSEGTCASTVNPWDGLRKPGTVGLPMPGQEVRIVDADGAGVGAGVTGEVQISGENVMAGYLGKPEDTRAVLADGWLKTGDLGHLDVDGYLVIDGRVKDMIIRGGENIYPREIEDVLASHPDVIDVAVVGRPDEKWGEIVTAFITTGRDSDASRMFDALEELCQAQLAPYKRPAVMSVLPALPLNPVGKIDKLRLRSIAIETQLSRGRV